MSLLDVLLRGPNVVCCAAMNDFLQSVQLKHSGQQEICAIALLLPKHACLLSAST
jgi:hypothetical protein